MKRPTKLGIVRYKLLKRIIHKDLETKTFYGTSINDFLTSASLIGEAIQSKDPLFIGRVGTVEMEVLNQYFAIETGIIKHYNDRSIRLLITNAGFFPKKNEYINRFCELYINCIQKIDCLAVMGSHGEDEMIKRLQSEPSLLCLRGLEPYYNLENPWSQYLSNKKVLVISPFSNTIESQYKNRLRLFPNTKVLPEFKLSTITAVQSIGVNTGGFDDWFQALEKMKEQMDQIEYDIVILGCGAYSIPLAAHAKESGKTCVIMGGATQVLFGICGKRWDNHPYISKLYNDSWVRPDKSEIPSGYESVESGCYW